MSLAGGAKPAGWNGHIGTNKALAEGVETSIARVHLLPGSRYLRSADYLNR